MFHILALQFLLVSLISFCLVMKFSFLPFLFSFVPFTSCYLTYILSFLDKYFAKFPLHTTLQMSVSDRIKMTKFSLCLIKHHNMKTYGK
jgi:hypothetical protein